MPIGDGKIELGLKIEPEPRISPEPAAKAQGRVAGDSAFAGYDLAHAVGRHVDLTREFGGGDAEFFQFILQDFTGCTMRLNMALSPVIGDNPHWTNPLRGSRLP